MRCFLSKQAEKIEYFANNKKILDQVLQFCKFLIFCVVIAAKLLYNKTNKNLYKYKVVGLFLAWYSTSDSFDDY